MTAAAEPLLNIDYHALPSLSSSGARKLLPPSCPALFKWERDHPVYKDIFDFGSAAHKMVLGDDLEELVIFEADAWTKKADQEGRKAAREAGKIPVLRREYNQVLEMAEAIKTNPTASILLDPASGKPEQSLFWEDERTGVQLRCRLDWLPHPVDGQRMIIPDYKTAASAQKDKFAKAAMNVGYHQQAAWYCDGVKANGLDEDPAFLFVVQEREAPYLVNVIELDRTAMNIGRILNRQAIDLYIECTTTDTWPAYSDGVELVGFPTYYINRFEDAA